MSKDVTTVYMVRHGTTALNERLCCQGWYDEPLNDVGFEQGRLLYDYFKDIPIDVGYTSPLKRASQTMDCLKGDRDFPVYPCDDLREMHFGDVEGRTFQEVNMLFPGSLKQFLDNAGALQNPNGETGEETYNRVVGGIKKIVSENPGKTIVMTYHGFAKQCWLNYAAGRGPLEMVEQCLSNVAVSKFTFYPDGSFVTDYVGDDSHLPDHLRINYDWYGIPLGRPLLLYYPKCSTCRKAKKFLDENNVDYIERDLVKDPIHNAEILSLMSRYDGPKKKFFNTSGVLYRSLGLKDLIPNMNDEDMAAWLATDGKLVKRPLLVFTDKVLVGFKQEEWEAAIRMQNAESNESNE